MPGPFAPVAPGTQYVIATSKNRTVTFAPKVQYVTVQPGGKFSFGGDLNRATLFPSMGKTLQAIGIRARQLRGQPTSDLVILQVTAGGVQVLAELNG